MGAAGDPPTSQTGAGKPCLCLGRAQPQPKPGERASAPAGVSCGCLFCSSCVECQAFLSGPFEKNCSQACPNIQVTKELTGVSRQCREKDSQNCWISFHMVQEDGEEIYTVTVNPEKGTPALLLLTLCRQAACSAAVASLPCQGLQLDAICLPCRVPRASKHRTDRGRHRGRRGPHRPGAPADLAALDGAV